MLRLKAHKIEVKWFDFERTLFQSRGMTLINCEIELPYQVLPLLMKPTRQIELAFEIGLVFCFRYGLGDSELQVFFRESDFKLSSTSPFFVISSQPDTKRAFHGRLT